MGRTIFAMYGTMDFRQEKAPRQGRGCPGPRALVDEAKDFASGEDTGQALEQPCEFIIATHARLAIVLDEMVPLLGVEPNGYPHQTFRLSAGCSP